MLNPAAPLGDLRKNLLDRAADIFNVYSGGRDFGPSDAWLADYRYLLVREQNEKAAEIAGRIENRGRSSVSLQIGDSQ